MFLDLNTVRTARDHFDKVYPPEGLSTDSDSFRVVAPAALAFDIVKDKQHFQLTGSVRTTLELTCGRCLEPFTMEIDAPFDLRYQPHASNTGEGEREIEEDDLTTAFYEDQRIDLGQLMREQFYLAVPMKPLCRELCRGLCPVCGTNLNRDACDCKRDWEDPRMAVLKELKQPRHEGH
jgi:uncharacterized protein